MLKRMCPFCKDTFCNIGTFYGATTDTSLKHYFLLGSRLAALAGEAGDLGEALHQGVAGKRFGGALLALAGRVVNGRLRASSIHPLEPLREGVVRPGVLSLHPKQRVEDAYQRALQAGLAQARLDDLE